MLTKKYNYFLFLFLTIILFINIFFLKNHKVNRFLLSSEKEYKAEDKEKLTKGKRLNSYFRRRILFFLLLLLIFLVFLVIIFFKLFDKYKKKAEEETVFNDLNLILNSKKFNYQRLSSKPNSEVYEIKNKNVFFYNGNFNKDKIKEMDNKIIIRQRTQIIDFKNKQIKEVVQVKAIDNLKEEAERTMKIKGFVNLLNRLIFKRNNDLKREVMINLDSIRFVFYCCFFHENFNDMFAEEDFIEKNRQDTKFDLSDDVKERCKEDKNGFILFNEEDSFKYGDNIYYFDSVKSVKEDDEYCEDDKFTLLSCKKNNAKKNINYYFFSQEIFWDDGGIYIYEDRNKKLIGTFRQQKRRCFPFATDFFSRQKMIETKNNLLDYFKNEKKEMKATGLDFFNCFISNLKLNNERKRNFEDVEKIKNENQEKDYLYFYNMNSYYLCNREMNEEEKKYYYNQRQEKEQKNVFYPCLDDKKKKCKIIKKVENAHGRCFVLEELSKGKFYILENVKKNIENIDKNGVYVLPEPDAFSVHSLFRQLSSIGKDNPENVLSNEKPENKKFQSYLDNFNIFLSGRNIVGAISYKIKVKGKKTIAKINDYLNRKYYNGNEEKEKNEEIISEDQLSKVTKNFSVFNFSNIFKKNDKVTADKRKEFYETELKIRKMLNKKHNEAPLKKNNRLVEDEKKQERNSWQKNKK